MHFDESNFEIEKIDVDVRLTVDAAGTTLGFGKRKMWLWWV